MSIAERQLDRKIAEMNVILASLRGKRGKALDAAIKQADKLQSEIDKLFLQVRY